VVKGTPGKDSENYAGQLIMPDFATKKLAGTEDIPKEKTSSFA
jgi:hypothetical protein